MRWLSHASESASVKSKCVCDGGGGGGGVDGLVLKTSVLQH